MKRVTYERYTQLRPNLASRLSDFSALSMEPTNRFTNQVSEYWYMGSMLARSVIEKKRMEE